MSNLFTDLGSLTGSDFLSGLGNTALGQAYGTKITNSVNKTITKAVTPKPATVAAPQAVISAPVSVSTPDQGLMKKIMIGVGSIAGLLVVIYLVKKGK